MTGLRRSPGCAARRWFPLVLLALLLTVGAAGAQPEPTEGGCDPAPGGVQPATGASPAPFPLVPTAAPPVGAPVAVPAVSIRVRVPASSEKDRDLTYRFFVENSSRALAHHVTARVGVPASAARYVRADPEPDDRSVSYVWRLGTLKPGERREISLVVQPTGDEDLSCCARVQFEHGQCVRTRVARGKSAVAALPAPPGKPALDVRISAPVETALYESLTYKVEVVNRGRGTARNVVLRHTLPAEMQSLNSKPAASGDNPLVWNLGDLAAGEARAVECQLAAKQVGRLASTVVAVADGDLEQKATHIVRVGQPRLSVVKTGPKQRGVNRPTTYDITVVNTGDWPMGNVEVTDEVPADIDFVSASVGGRFEAGKVRWAIGTLAPGSKTSVRLVVRSRRAGTFKNVCTASADRGLTEQARTETRFEAADGLFVEVEKDRDPVEAGQEAFVSVRVRNGGRAAESNVDVVLTIPDGLSVLEVRGPTSTDRKGPKLRLPRLDRLPPGTERVAILRVRGEQPGELKLGIETISDSTGPDRAVKVEETLTVLKPAAGVTHTTTAKW